jgi:hypothetical protein
VADLDPIDKGKVNGVVFDLLDHLDEWYGQDAEIEHLLVVARGDGRGRSPVHRRRDQSRHTEGGGARDAEAGLRHPQPAGRADGLRGPGATELVAEGVRWLDVRLRGFRNAV